MNHYLQSRGNKPGRISRRGLAVEAGALAIAPILAACGDSTPTTPAAANPTTAASATTAASVTTATSTKVAATIATGTTSVAISADTTTAAVSKPSIVTMMLASGTFPTDFYKKFMDANPGLTLKVIENDHTRFKAMVAVGTSPDLLR